MLKKSGAGLIIKTVIWGRDEKQTNETEYRAQGHTQTCMYTGHVRNVEQEISVEGMYFQPGIMGPSASHMKIRI